MAVKEACRWPLLSEPTAFTPISLRIFLILSHYLRPSSLFPTYADSITQKSNSRSKNQDNTEKRTKIQTQAKAEAVILLLRQSTTAMALNLAFLFLSNSKR